MLPFLLLVPVVVALAFFLISKHVCWKEFLVVLTVTIAVNLAGYGLSFMGVTRDVELWNGDVISKAKVKVSCEHSYDCFCYDSCSTDANGYQSCTQICQTCYDHSHDFDWRVETTLSPVNIQRLDAQGLKEPPRWTSVQRGEPVSEAHGFKNYIKAAPGSVLRPQGQTEAFRSLLPAYPKVYDYYRVRHLIPVQVALPNFEASNDYLGRINGVLGPARQVNFMIVVVKTPNQAYTHALEEHWLGGKKNDLIVVLGVPDGRDRIEWASVISWSEVELLKVELRDLALDLGSVTKLDQFIEQSFRLIGKKFVRKPMADFEYLRYQYSPSPGLMFFLLFLGLAICIGLSVYFVHQDPFESGLRMSYRRRW